MGPAEIKGGGELRLPCPAAVSEACRHVPGQGQGQAVHLLSPLREGSCCCRAVRQLEFILVGAPGPASNEAWPPVPRQPASRSHCRGLLYLCVTSDHCARRICHRSCRLCLFWLLLAVWSSAEVNVRLTGPH